MALLTDATPAHEVASMKDAPPSKTTMLPLSSLLTLQAKACGPWLLGMSLGSRCHHHRVVRCELLPSILPDCLAFHLQGPRIVVLSLSPLTVLINIWPIVWIHNRFSCTRVNCDFSASTSLTICCNGFAVDGHVATCDCVLVHLVKPPLSIIGVVARSVFS